MTFTPSERAENHKMSPKFTKRKVRNMRIFTRWARNMKQDSICGVRCLSRVCSVPGPSTTRRHVPVEMYGKQINLNRSVRYSTQHDRLTTTRATKDELSPRASKDDKIHRYGECLVRARAGRSRTLTQKRESELWNSDLETT